MNQELHYYLKSRSRVELIELIPDHVNTVLEVGCGAGFTGSDLKRAGYTVYGVDSSSVAIELARKTNSYEALTVVDIESVNTPFPGIRFDSILYPDVLEHLVDPWALLNKHHAFLSKHGVVVASIPNVRYYRVSLGLILKGNWNYVAMGVLDRTHLRFFTKKTIMSMFKDAGYTDIQIHPKLHVSRKWGILNKLLLNALSDFFALQYLVVARKI